MYVVNRQKQKQVQQKLAEQKRDALQSGDKVFVKVFRRKWFNKRHERPFEVVHSTGTAVQAKRSPTWYHLSHCVKAPTEEEIQIQEQKHEDSGGLREKTDRLETRKDVQDQDPKEEANDAANAYDASVHVPDDTSQNSPDDEERRRFGVIDLQHVPGTTVVSPSKGDQTKTQERTNDTSRRTRESVVPRRPRSVRNKTKPKRKHYEN